MAKKRQKNSARRNNAEISEIYSTKLKSGVGATSVNLRYHKRDEYLNLAVEHKKELHFWSESSAGSDKKFKDDKSNKRPAHRVKSDTEKRMKRMISYVIAKFACKG